MDSGFGIAGHSKSVQEMTTSKLDYWSPLVVENGVKKSYTIEIRPQSIAAAVAALSNKKRGGEGGGCVYTQTGSLSNISKATELSNGSNRSGLSGVTTGQSNDPLGVDEHPEMKSRPSVDETMLSEVGEEVSRQGMAARMRQERNLMMQRRKKTLKPRQG